MLKEDKKGKQRRPGGYNGGGTKEIIAIMNALIDDDAMSGEVIRRLCFTHRDVILKQLRDTRKRLRAMRRGDYGKRYVSGKKE